MSEMNDAYASLGTSVTELVTAGAELLDAHEPRWETRINTDALIYAPPTEAWLQEINRRLDVSSEREEC